MRRFIPALLVTGLLLGPGCRIWNNPFDPENANNPPLMPTHPLPDSGAVRQDTVVLLSWNGGDPDSGDVVRYDLHFGTALPPPVLMRRLDSSRYSVGGLDYSTLYHWQVLAFDAHGDSAVGPVWSFTTWAETDTNQPPYSPSVPSPGNGAGNVDTTVILGWSGGDPDSGDVVRYDVYFGTSTIPPLVRAAVDTSAYDPGNVGFLTQYFWRVVSFDNHGDSADGPLWSFTTAAHSDTNRPPNRPAGPTPDSGATGRTRQAVLGWQGGDPDPGDTVTYDVYFGTTTSPPRIGVNLPSPSWTPSGLEPATAYYWRVVARDREGDTTAGPLWLFQTMAAISVTSPAAGTRWREGSQQTVRWTGGTDEGGGQRAEVVTRKPEGRGQNAEVEGARPGREPRGPERGLLTDGPDSTVVYYSGDNGGSWSRQAKATVPGELAWTVAAAASQAKVQVRVYADGLAENGTSETFQVYDSLQPSVITVTSPARGARWEAGSNQVITWTGGTDGFDSAVVRYSPGGGQWTRQGRAVVPGSFAWTVPEPMTSLAQVEVTAWCAGRTRVGLSDTFSVVGPSVPDTVVAVLPTGEKPQDLVWNPAGNKVYSADYQSGTVTVIDGATDSVLATLPVGANPSALVYDEARDEVWVANLGSQSLSVIDGAGNRVVDSVHVGSTPQSLAVSATSGKVYVTNYSADSLTVVDAASRQVVARVATGESPRHIAWHPYLNRMYVPCFSNNELTVVDCATDSVLARVGVGFGACWAVVDTELSEVWVANQLGGNVSIVNCVTNTPVMTITTAAGPCALAFNPTSNKVYCANKDDDAVSAIGTLSRDVQHIGTGAGPRSLVWCPVINKLYVGCYDGDVVTLINGVNGGVERTIDAGIGDRPRALAWNRTSSKVYCANYGANTVSVIGSGE